jgi:hypothetical protein
MNMDDEYREYMERLGREKGREEARAEMIAEIVPPLASLISKEMATGSSFDDAYTNAGFPESLREHVRSAIQNETQ